MDYKKIQNKNYNIHLINTKRFKTVTIEIDFSSLASEKSISYNKLLSKLIPYSSKEYDTSKKLSIKEEELYGSDFFALSSLLGKIATLELGITFTNPKYTNKDEWENNLNFLYNNIFNPNVVGSSFEEISFEIVKSSLISNLKKQNEYPRIYANKKFRKIMFKNTIAEFAPSGDKEIIEKINSRDIYNYYKNLIENSKVNIFICGQIDQETEIYLLKEIEKKFSILKSNQEENLNPFINREISNETKEIIEQKNVTQSQLLIGLSFDGLTNEQKNYSLNMYNIILGGGVNSLLFNKVREENSFCYSIHSSTLKYSQAIIIEAGINKSNYKKALSVAKECIALMNDKTIIEQYLENIKKEIGTLLNNHYDSKTSIMSHYFQKEFIQKDDIEVSREKYNNISVQDVLEINKHITLSVIYFLEGTKVEDDE